MNINIGLRMLLYPIVIVLGYTNYIHTNIFSLLCFMSSLYYVFLDIKNIFTRKYDSKHVLDELFLSIAMNIYCLIFVYLYLYIMSIM